MTKPSKPAVWMLLLAGITLSLGFLLRSFLMENIVAPAAYLLWTLGRVVTSVDQSFYWGALICVTLVIALARLFRLTAKSPALDAPISSDFCAILERMHSWHNLIQWTSYRSEESKILEQNLSEMLAQIIASHQTDTPPFIILKALKNHELPIPDSIHRFLFSTEPSGTQQLFQQWLETVGEMPRKTIRHWMGRDMDEYLLSLERTISFLESSLEKKR
jgi:hypothetical protein